MMVAMSTFAAIMMMVRVSVQDDFHGLMVNRSARHAHSRASRMKREHGY